MTIPNSMGMPESVTTGPGQLCICDCCHGCYDAPLLWGPPVSCMDCGAPCSCAGCHAEHQEDEW